MSHVAPGVYSKIFDLSEYIQAVPSTIGFICSLTPKGQDNKLKFIGSRSEYIGEFGEPNIMTYGKNYGQGPYCAYNFLGESGALFHIRCFLLQKILNSIMHLLIHIVINLPSPPIPCTSKPMSCRDIPSFIFYFH